MELRCFLEKSIFQQQQHPLCESATNLAQLDFPQQALELLESVPAQWDHHHQHQFDLVCNKCRTKTFNTVCLFAYLWSSILCELKIKLS